MTTTDTTETVAAPPSGGGGRASGANVGPTLIGALVVLAGCIVALALGVVARHHAGSSKFAGSEKVTVHLHSFRIDLSRTTVAAGKVGFDVHNDASIDHEFVVIKTDLPAAQLPLGKDGDVIEDAPQLDVVAESDRALAPGSARAVFGDLGAGHYAVLCNLPGHYQSGMHVDFTVTASSGSRALGSVSVGAT